MKLRVGVRLVGYRASQHSRRRDKAGKQRSVGRDRKEDTPKAPGHFCFRALILHHHQPQAKPWDTQ